MRKTILHVQTDTKTRSDLVLIAKEQRTSLSNVIRWAILDYIEKKKFEGRNPIRH